MGAVVNVGPGEYFVFGTNLDLGTNGGIVVDYDFGAFQLSNGDDEIVLTFGGVEIDRVNYDDLNFPDDRGMSALTKANG